MMNNQCPFPEWADKLTMKPEDLSSSELAALDAHVIQCPACSTARADYASLITQLRAFPSPAVKPSPRALTHLLDDPLDGKATAEARKQVSRGPARRYSSPRTKRVGSHAVSAFERFLAVAVVACIILASLLLFGLIHSTLTGRAGHPIPNPSSQQAGVRVLSVTTRSYSQTVLATGTRSIPGTHASGTVLIDNFDTSSSLTLNAGSVYVNNYSSIHIHMVLDATVTVPPAPSSTTWSQRAAPGHILEVGTIGNNEFNNNEFGTLTWSVFNNPFFSNGKDPQNYTFVQQSDINVAARALESANTPNPQQVLEGQIHTNDHLISTPSCNPKVTANHKADDIAITVTVTVSFICTGMIFSN